MGAKWDFYKDLALTSLAVIAFQVGRKLSPETLGDIAEELNNGKSGKLFVPVYAADLCCQSSYALFEGGTLYLDGRTLDSFIHAPIRDKNTALRSILTGGRESCVGITQKIARRIAKAAQREGLEVPPYVQYRATRSDGKLAEYTQTAAMCSAIGLSWFVVGSAGLAHVFEIFQVQPITESCKPAVRAQATQSLCYEWNQKEQAVSVWKKKTRDEINKNLPFYAPPFSYKKVQNIPYSDVPNHPEAIDALTAYAGKAGCPTVSSQKLRQTFEGISQVPVTPEVKQAATVRVVEQIVQTPKNACSML